MDTTDFLLLYFGACCLGAAIIGLMCERAPVMDWQNEPEDHGLRDIPRITMTHGGVIQRAKPAVPPKPESYIVPVVCTQYYRRQAWYVCGTTQDIIDHLWLKREPVHTEDDDGA